MECAGAPLANKEEREGCWRGEGKQRGGSAIIPRDEQKESNENINRINTRHCWCRLSEGLQTETCTLEPQLAIQLWRNPHENTSTHLRFRQLRPDCYHPTLILLIFNLSFTLQHKQRTRGGNPVLSWPSRSRQACRLGRSCRAFIKAKPDSWDGGQFALVLFQLCQPFFVIKTNYPQLCNYSQQQKNVWHISASPFVKMMVDVPPDHSTGH